MKKEVQEPGALFFFWVMIGVVTSDIHILEGQSWNETNKKVDKFLTQPVAKLSTFWDYVHI